MSKSPAALTNQNRRFILHWFRLGDLRVHDNPALVHSKSLLASTIGSPTEQDVILPIFCFDNKIFGNGAFTRNARSVKCGVRRAKFILESVIDLRKQLQKECNSELLVAYGDPAHVVDHLVDYIYKNYATSNIRVVCQQEVASEELQVVKDVKSVLFRHFPGTNDKLLLEVWGSTMHNLCDLPYDRAYLHHLPNSFTAFRVEMEKKNRIGRPLPIPRFLPWPIDWPDALPEYKGNSFLNSPLVLSSTYMPTLQELGYTEEQIQEAEQHDPRGVMIFKGGETAGLARVQEYIWEKDLLKDYYDTRNGMIGADCSTKFSPWLAHGCLSPRHIVAECSRYEKERVKNKSTYWLVFELLWRDYCKFFMVKYKTRVFFPNGVQSEKKSWTLHKPIFEAWKEGRTGYPLIDANMREMKATGYMSNRGRQNVASFLALDLNFDWRHGGDWFESNLIDYDVYSNWVNWCAAAGVTRGRINRFNIIKQSRDYDQFGEYVRLWLPELKDVPLEFVHEPWKMTKFQQIEYNCHLGVDYPNPIIPPHAYNSAGKPGMNRGDNTAVRAYVEKRRQPNISNRNRHQKYEMGGLKEGKYKFDGGSD